MYARIAKWEGADGEAIRAFAKETSAEAEAGPPEGLPAKGLMLFIDPDNGRSLAITLFESEEDLHQGDETLNSMSPGRDDVGKRTSVETYEVAADIRM